MACSCESGAAPKALAVPQYDTDQEPMLEPKVVQLPGLQQTLRPGEELLPYGLFLPATGQILGLQAHECGNSFIPLQGIPEELLNPYEESMGSWLSDDMRLCGCSGTSRDPVKAEDVLQALKAEATRTNRPAPIRTGAEGWSDSMRGLRSGARQAPRGSAARQEDEPHRGSRGDIEREVPYEWEEPDDGTRTLPRDCVSSATVEPDDVRELRNICKINLGHSGLLGRELEVKIPSGYTASRSRGEMKEAYLSDWLDLCVPAGASDWSQANRALLYNSEKNPGLFWNSEKGYYHGFLLHAIRTVYGCRGVLGESSFKSDLGVYLDKCKMAPSDLRSLENEGKTWLVSNGVLCGGNKRYIQVDAQGVVKISGGGGVANHQAYASLGKVWLCPR